MPAAKAGVVVRKCCGFNRVLIDFKKSKVPLLVHMMAAVIRPIPLELLDFELLLHGQYLANVQVGLIGLFGVADRVVINQMLSRRRN